MRLFFTFVCLFVVLTSESFSLDSYNYPNTEDIDRELKPLYTSDKRKIISTEIDLGGKSLKLDEGTKLVIREGGCIKNGILDLCGCEILTSNEGVFNNCLVLNTNLKASWFADTDFSKLLSSQKISFSFNVDKNIIIDEGCEIKVPVRLFSKNGHKIAERKPLYITHMAKGSIIEGITFDGEWRNSICLWLTASDINIADCKFLHYKGDDVYVIYLGRMQSGYNENIRIHGCMFDGMESVTDGVGVGNGIKAAIFSTSSYHNIEIYDCVFKNQKGEDDGEGINISGDILESDTPWPNINDTNTLRFGDLNAKIHNNHFYDMTVSAIKVFGKNVEIYNNYIFNSTWNVERGGKSLIRVLEAENVNVSNNTFVSTIDVGCFAVMNSCNVVFKNNTFNCDTRDGRGLATGSAYFKFQNVKDVKVENISANIKQGAVSVNTSVFNIMAGDNVRIKDCDISIDNTDCLYEVLTGNTYGNLYLENCKFKASSSCAKWIYVNSKQYNGAKIYVRNVTVSIPGVIPPGLTMGSAGTLPYVIRNLKANGQLVANSTLDGKKIDLSSLMVSGAQAKLRNLTIRQNTISGAIQLLGEGDYEFDGIKAIGDNIAYLMNVRSQYRTLKIRGVKFSTDKAMSKGNVVRTFNGKDLEKISWGKQRAKLKDL